MPRKRRAAIRLLGHRAQATRALYHDSDNQTVLVIFETSDEEYEFELTVREARILLHNLKASLTAIDSINGR